MVRSRPCQGIRFRRRRLTQSARLRRCQFDKAACQRHRDRLRQSTSTAELLACNCVLTPGVISDRTLRLSAESSSTAHLQLGHELLQRTFAARATLLPGPSGIIIGNRICTQFCRHRRRNFEHSPEPWLEAPADGVKLGILGELRAGRLPAAGAGQARVSSCAGTSKQRT